MSFYQVDSVRLRGKKDELTALLQKFRQEKDILCSKELSLRSMWEGAANDSFHEQFMRNAGQMDSFIEVISRYLEVIGYIADRYDMAERRNTGRVM
ncbi:MAG: WXG100 family type VII secretion target [Lachnospiraceae bacterium]|nr:WXG100 family type VII secretion target [Lachnospiraceae bacterium]